MTGYATATATVGGNPAQLRDMAARLGRLAERVSSLAGSADSQTTGTTEFWRGPAGTAYRARAKRQVSTLRALPPPLVSGAAAYEELATRLSAAHHRAAAAVEASTRLGLGDTDLVNHPGNVAAFLLRHPGHFGTLAGLIGEILGARQQADDARDRFVAEMAGIRQSTQEAEGDRREPDERDGRRIRNDEIFGRSEGGDRGGGHLDNDWAGRAILERYLRGGDDWTIVDDEDWSRYMMANERLRTQLTDPAQQEAQNALANYLDGRGPAGTFGRQFDAEIENGEGIVGYQYLHGTNAEAGRFEFNGTTSVAPQPNGTYQVTLNSGYTWNDVIDPNPQYTTDTWKSRLAEVLTFGQADPYDIHLTWHAETTVLLDSSGNVLSIEGYPAP